MITSPTIAELAKALAKFNINAPAIVKDSKNPHYKNTYSSLAAILDAVRVPLAENGISIVQLLGESSLTTMLLHESGEFMQTTAPLLMQRQDAQGYGSASSYQRRYSALAILALSSSDDDGQEASSPPGRSTATNPLPRVETKERKGAEVTDVNRKDNPKTDWDDKDALPF